VNFSSLTALQTTFSPPDFVKTNYLMIFVTFIIPLFSSILYNFNQNLIIESLKIQKLTPENYVSGVS